MATDKFIRESAPIAKAPGIIKVIRIALCAVIALPPLLQVAGVIEVSWFWALLPATIVAVVIVVGAVVLMLDKDDPCRHYEHNMKP